MNKELIAAYGLEPHPEGGYYKETYRSAEKMTTRGGVSRPISTGILFLLPEGERSRLHRIKSDELWHFHLGGPLRLTQIAPEGAVTEVVLGPDFKAGHRLQHVVPARHWFGAAPEPGAGFCFVGCTVAPGFDFDDFDLGPRATLLARFPDARETIMKLTD